MPQRTAYVVDVERDGKQASTFDQLRGEALRGYEVVEESLKLLYTKISEKDKDDADMMWNELTARGRSKILKKTLEKKLRKGVGNQYRVFCVSLLKFIEKEITEERNRIVHWKIVRKLWIGDSRSISEDVLMPNDMNTQNEISREKLWDFILRCEYVALMIIRFGQILSETTKPDGDEQKLWWKEKVQWPPPESHGLAREKLEEIKVKGLATGGRLLVMSRK